MDWTTPLRAQQVDFVQRLKFGDLLHCDKEGQHSELTVISGEKLKQLRDFCWVMVKKYKPNDPKIYFLNNMKGKLGEEVVKTRLADFVTEVDYDKRVSGDGKVDFTLTSEPSVGIQVKARHDSIDTVKWSISQEEIEKNAEAYFNRGAARYALRDKQSAIKDFKTAANIYKTEGKEIDYQSAIQQISKISK